MSRPCLLSLCRIYETCEGNDALCVSQVCLCALLNHDRELRSGWGQRDGATSELYRCVTSAQQRGDRNVSVYFVHLTFFLACRVLRSQLGSTTSSYPNDVSNLRFEVGGSGEPLESVRPGHRSKLSPRHDASSDQAGWCIDVGMATTTQEGGADMATVEAGSEKPWTVPDSKGIGYETVVQVTPRDLWYWQAETHWKHWHGFWVTYEASLGKSNVVAKEYKSVRSFQNRNPERTTLFHRNTWYDAKGFGKDRDRVWGPWDWFLEEHALPDGLMHPASESHRVLMTPSGNLGWVQLYLKPGAPRGVIYLEPIFYINPNQRISVSMGYDSTGNSLEVCLLLEETKDSEDKLDSSWSGTLWKHSRDPLEDTREEPKGTFRGREESMNTKLEWGMREAEWLGFKGGLSEEEAKHYALVHMPTNITVFVPRKAAVHKDHAYYVTYVESATRVRVISAVYGADLNFKHIKFGVYDKVE